MHCNVTNAIAVYVAVFLILITVRPSFCMYDNGRMKPFGVDPHETLLPVPLVALIVALLVYTVLLFQNH